jgi:chromosomal replication initiator protein
MAQDTIQHFWKALIDEIRKQVSEAAWQAWFSHIKPLEFDGQTLILRAPSSLAKERLESRFSPLLRTAAQDILQKPIVIEITIDESNPQISLENPSSYQPIAEKSQFIPIDKSYTFETFVIGSSNRFAHAAALSVAENPGKAYNPLFIHGGAGLGKTHLLKAIENYTYDNFPSLIVKYVSTETFLNEFVDAIKSASTSAFKRRYRECDVLLVDDIQFLESKESLQEEFFHTFNSLYTASKQVVITSDRPPKALATIEDRLQSRFLSGLTVDVQPPDLETRLAILRSKAEREDLEVPQEILTLIAENITDNIRELEGALIRVTAYSRLNSLALDLDTARNLLSDILSTKNAIQITPHLILKAIAQEFGFDIEELCGNDRHRPLVHARQIGMYITRELTDFSYPTIAKEFGGRDHTTVIHAVEKIAREMSQNKTTYDQVTQIIKRLKSGYYNA